MTMKLRRKIKKGSKDTKPHTQIALPHTVITPAGVGTVRLWHSQSVKQSMNYQSADCAYGVEFIVADNDDAIAKAVERAEDIVEGVLVEKIQQHTKFLTGLGASNRS